MADDPAIAQLTAAGLDLVHPFDAQAIARDGLEWLGGRQRRGLLIGNTRALWPPFRAAIAADAALAADPDPLERYVERTIEAAYPGARIYYGHRRYGDGFLPMRRLAVETGLGAVGDGGLVVHPLYGPWIALRAVVVIDGEPVPRAPIARPCSCDGRCGEAQRVALAARGPDAWRAWLAVRDACTMQRWRYTDDQIRYHYTKTWHR